MLAAFRAAVKTIKEANRISNEVNGRLSTDIVQAMTALRASQAKTLAGSRLRARRASPRHS
jgi:hypothetical protein